MVDTILEGLIRDMKHLERVQSMTTSSQVPASWVRDHLKGPNPALLACACEDESQCRDLMLPHSIAMKEVRDRLPPLLRTQSIML